jgi:hypothetical protein
MVTRGQIEKIGARLEALAVALDVGQPLYVWWELDESEQEALARVQADGRPVVLVRWLPEGATG